MTDTAREVARKKTAAMEHLAQAEDLVVAALHSIEGLLGPGMPEMEARLFELRRRVAEQQRLLADTDSEEWSLDAAHRKRLRDRQDFEVGMDLDATPAGAGERTPLGRHQARQLQAAAADLLPLAQKILELSMTMRGPGLSELPVNARGFFLYAACLGVVRFLELDGPLHRGQLEAAKELAPEIVTALRTLSAFLGPAPTKN